MIEGVAAAVLLGERERAVLRDMVGDPTEREAFLRTLAERMGEAR